MGNNNVKRDLLRRRVKWAMESVEEWTEAVTLLKKTHAYSIEHECERGDACDYKIQGAHAGVLLEEARKTLVDLASALVLLPTSAEEHGQQEQD